MSIILDVEMLEATSHWKQSLADIILYYMYILAFRMHDGCWEEGQLVRLKIATYRYIHL